MTARWIPRHKELKAQCVSCPFGDNTKAFGEVLNKLRVAEGMKPLAGKAVLYQALQAKFQIEGEVRELGGDFVCHHTAYDSTGAALVRKPAAEHRQCPGASAFKRGTP